MKDLDNKTNTKEYLSCVIGKCALSKIYPNTDAAGYACDEDCYFSYCGEQSEEKYKNKHKDIMIDCGIYGAK